MTSILLKFETVQKIGVDTSDRNEMAVLKFAEADALDDLKKFGFVRSPSRLGLDLSKSTHKRFLDELRKASDLDELPESAMAYDSKLAPLLAPSKFSKS